MIINIKGTSGSGKSTLTRAVMAMYTTQSAVLERGRKKPMFYIHHREDMRGMPLVVVGHYEIKNGGVDTIKDIDEAYEIIDKCANRDMDVLYEGKCMSDGVPNIMSLVKKKHDVRVLALTTPIDVCVASVRERGHKIAATSIAKTMAKVDRDCKSLRALGVMVMDAGREEAPKIIKHWLKL